MSIKNPQLDLNEAVDQENQYENVEQIGPSIREIINKSRGAMVKIFVVCTISVAGISGCTESPQKVNREGRVIKISEQQEASRITSDIIQPPMQPTALEKLRIEQAVLTVKERSPGEYYYENEKGENAFEDKVFSEAGEFVQGIARVREKERHHWYYINKTGNNAFEYKTFCEAEPFSEGFALVRNNYNEDYYYINKKGENAFGEKFFKEATSYHQGLAVVKNTLGAYYYINKNGENEFGKHVFYEATPYNRGLAVVKDRLGDYYT